MECTSMEPTVLRTTKIGNGFVKEDVLTYLDELNSKIESLEEDLKKAKETGSSDPQELTKYRNQVDNLQEKLNASNNALRAARKENEELKKQLEAAGRGGAQAGAPVNPQAQQALEAAKKEIESLRNQLKSAQAAGGQGNAQAAAQAQQALEAAKKEIDTLRGQVKAAEQKAAAAEQKAASAAPAGAASGNPAAEAELVKVKADLERIGNDLENMTTEMAAKRKELSEKDEKIAALTKEMDEAVAKAVSEKDEKIKSLNEEIEQLKDDANNPVAMMGTMFAEAQKTVNALKAQAKSEAEAVTKDAKDKAAQMTKEASEVLDKATREANQKADQIINDANRTAEKTIAEADSKAKATVAEADSKAKATVAEADSKADKVNEMSNNVRRMLLSEIESVNTKFSDIYSSISKLTTQATDRMNQAKNIFADARSTVEEATKSDNASNKPKFDSFGGAPKKETKPEENKSSSDNWANSFAKSASTENEKPAASQKSDEPAQKNKNFNFDMAELLKAAEEAASNEGE